MGYHRCGDVCASNTDVATCGATSCTACPAPPANARATCNGTSCDFECEGTRRRCGSTCVDATADKANCGTCGNRCDAVTASAICVASVCEIENLTRNVCSAQWVGGSDAAGMYPVLLCPSTQGDARGWFLVTNNPTLSDGMQYRAPAVAMHPYRANDGVLSGAWPAIRVEAGSRFRAAVGCAANSSGCNMKYQVTYEGPAGLRLLTEGTIVAGGSVAMIDVSLAALVGQNIGFSLVAIVQPPYSSSDTMFWINPRIERP